ncbi:MAG: hypothetical protein SFW36_04640 [Leptolyngbyaceae cyanobacterium bins.59]|nr:hypothetical protein [Leptolyngbyaceae cyanobacterium bins.59]
MINLVSIITFSQQHCITICALLVPLNLGATLWTLINIVLGSFRSIWLTAGLAFLFASLMILHVLSWLAVGVIMAPSFILLGLGLTCLFINSWAILNPMGLQKLLHHIWKLGRNFVASIA